MGLYDATFKDKLMLPNLVALVLQETLDSTGGRSNARILCVPFARKAGQRHRHQILCGVAQQNPVSKGKERIRSKDVVKSP